MYKLLCRSIKVILALFLLTTFLPSASQAYGMGASLEIQQEGEDPSLGDAKVYAKLYGISLEETLHRFDIQDTARLLQADVSAHEADTFAGLWVEHSPEFRVVILFTKDASQTIEPYLSKEYMTKELAKVLDARTTKASLAELEKIQQELLTSLTDLEIHLESEINVYNNNITLAIVEADKERFDLSLQNDLIKLPDYVIVITIPSLGNTESNIYGGLAMNRCSTSFSVQDIYGVLGRGVITAGHCSDDNYILQYNGVNLPLQGKLKTGSYDVGWHTTLGFTVTNQFKAGNADIRRVTSTRSRNDQIIGELVCKFGVNTGYTCGHISSKNVNGNVIPPLSATFIRVNNDAGYNDLSSPGDSGAPWFNGNTAYGVHHASDGVDPNDALYMAIDYIDALGVSVVLNPVFADVPWTHTAWQDIERLYNSGITGGCSTNPLNYCPNSTITRAEMAVFLLRGIHGSSYNPPPVGSSTGFNDVPTSHWAAAWIKQFAAEGITGGCGSGNYCPEATTTNAQMSIFLLRSKHGAGYNPPAVGANTGFNDVSTAYWAAAWIKQLKVEGITTGCGGGNYCPESNVTRAQMAGLLVRTFNLP